MGQVISPVPVEIQAMMQSRQKVEWLQGLSVAASEAARVCMQIAHSILASSSVVVVVHSMSSVVVVDIADGWFESILMEG